MSNAPDVEVRLVRALANLQREKGWSDSYVAGRLGVHRSLWNGTRREKTPLRYKVFTGIRDGFKKELALETVLFLTADANVISNNGEEVGAAS